MKRLVTLAVCGLLASACSENEPPSSSTSSSVARQPVARAALARLDAELGPLPQPAAADAELREHVAGLVETFSGSDESLRRLAREELAGLGPTALAELSTWLSNPAAPADQRESVARVLAECDAPFAAELLVRRIELARTQVDPEAWVRAHCAWRLGETTQDWVVPRLLLHLRYEKDNETVIWLARTLAHFGNFAGLDALDVIARSAATQELRDAATQSAVQIARDVGLDGDVAALWRAWADGDPDARLASAPFSRAHEREIWRLVAGFSEWQLRGVDDGRFVLQREGGAAAPLLAAALADENRYVRTHAAQTLERMGPRAASATPALVAALDDPELAPQAALALGALGARAAATPLVERLDARHPLELRVAAARALGRLKLDSVSAALDRARAESEPLDLRVAAACSRLLCAPNETPRECVEFVLHHFAAGEVESAGPEVALDAWLAARADSEPAARAELDAWRAIAPTDPVERVARRSQLVRDALPRLFGQP